MLPAARRANNTIEIQNDLLIAFQISHSSDRPGLIATRSFHSGGEIKKLWFEKSSSLLVIEEVIVDSCFSASQLAHFLGGIFECAV